MYSSEYLRNKKRAAPRVLAPTSVATSGLWTQMKRYKSSVPQNLLPISAGQSKLLSGDGVLNAKGGIAVCCGPAQETVTLSATCCDLVNPPRYPTNFYGVGKQDCCPINGPAVVGSQCCPSLPKNSPLITWTKRPTTEG